MKVTTIRPTPAEIERNWHNYLQEQKNKREACRGNTHSDIAEIGNKPAWRGHHMDIWI